MIVLPDYVIEHGAKSWKHSKISIRITQVAAKLEPLSPETSCHLHLCLCLPKGN